MVETGKRVWGRHWEPLYDSLGTNPFAAMPSLHFATSAMAVNQPGLGSAADGKGEQGIDRGFERTRTPTNLGEQSPSLERGEQAGLDH